MRKNVVRTTLLGLTLISACSDEADNPPGPAERITASGAHVLRGQGGALTPPSLARPAAIATSFVKTRPAGAAADVAVVAEVPGAGGVTHVRFEQRAGGLRVDGAYARVAVAATGEVVQLVDQLAPSGAVAPAAIDARDALSAAMTSLGYHDAIGAAKVLGAHTQFAVAGDFHRLPTVERVAYATDGGLREGFLVETWTGRTNRLVHTLVGGDGALVRVEHRTNTDAYNVFVEDPLKGPQTVEAGPGAGSAESPAGWLAGAQTTVNISGNNAHAYLDTDANNAPDAGGSAVTTGQFLTAVDLGAAPSTAGNRAVAVQNLFYLNNVVHDTLYRHGFNEAAGNFQNDNFGLGGAGNDAVNAEAQDGGGTDNANFATPSDGSAPRMQMYLWTGSSPDGLVTVDGNDYGAYGSAFGPKLTASGVTGPLALYDDGTGVSSDGCETSTGSLTGAVAIVDRGTCNFTVKVLNAQKAGAIAVLIVNNVAGPAFGPGGTERRVKIPSAMVTLDDGAVLRGLLGSSANLRSNPVPALQIDGDLDSDVVFHEYGHGLTWRMIGGMSGAMSGAIGEGAADVNAFLIDGDPIIGEYAYSNPGGIRRYSYAGYPLTYGDFSGSEVHNDGEIYAAAMWRVLENYQGAGLTADDLHGDFVDGMNYTPSSPAFEDMRDGMLQSVAGTGRECLVWRGFAATGVGVGAGVTIRGNRVTVTESFALPPGC